MSYAPLPSLLLWLQMLKIENKKWKYVNIWWHIVIIWRTICWYDVMGMSIIYNLGLWNEIEHRYVQQTCIRKINGSDDIPQFLIENDWSRMTKLTLYRGISNFFLIEIVYSFSAKIRWDALFKSFPFVGENHAALTVCWFRPFVDSL